MLEMKKPELKTVSESADKSNLILKMEPLERGFGITIGNCLRRILLGSLPGAAVVGVKINGVEHEFSAIKGVKEEVTEIILNLKSLRFKINVPVESIVRPFECRLKTNKVGAVLAGEISTSSDIEVVNKYYIKDRYYYYGINEYKSKDYSVYGKNFTNKNLAKITNRIKITPDMKIQDEYLISKENIYYLGKKIDNIDLNTFQNLK